LLGINGSGKSTLLQIIAGYTNPTKGKVVYIENGNNLDQSEMYTKVSYCAPYLELIEEMTLTEFLTYHFSFKKAMLPVQDIIQHVGLESSTHKLISNFSSGMKQRVKLAQAILADTAILLLDEPCTNLDEEGIVLYKKLLNQFAQQKLVIVASNDKNEYDVCATHLKISDFKPNHHDRTGST
jgi:ABC-type multidrug transport system ATPase subunit